MTDTEPPDVSVGISLHLTVTKDSVHKAQALAGSRRVSLSQLFSELVESAHRASVEQANKRRFLKKSVE